ncbi:MAG TPA: hypothetical protein VGB32_06255 [Candidatus Bathyarchaeia archaeon]
MSLLNHVYPEIWLSIIAVVVFFPMMFMLVQQKSFDLWRFSLLFTLIIFVIYFYTFIDMRRNLK